MDISTGYIPSIRILVYLTLMLMAFSATAQSGKKVSQTQDEIFEQVRDTAFICFDSGKMELLSTHTPPRAEECKYLYGECEGDDCMLVYRGAVKRFDKSLLLRLGEDILKYSAEAGGNGQQAQFPGSSPWNNGFVDPVCTIYHQLGFDCPEGSGLPGAGTPPDGNGVPGTPGDNDNCFLCSLEYTLCFAGAGINPILQGYCMHDLKVCAAKRCG